MNGDLYSVLIGSCVAQGQLSILEETIPPGSGPPRHNHLNEDEIFYVTHGQLDISAGDDTFIAQAGSLIFMPGGMMHGFRNNTKDFAKQLLIFTSGASKGSF